MIAVVKLYLGSSAKGYLGSLRWEPGVIFLVWGERWGRVNWEVVAVLVLVGAVWGVFGAEGV